MIHSAEAAAIADRLHNKAMSELHPDLFQPVTSLLLVLSRRFLVRCGFRGKVDQRLALRNGDSDADWLESPHNYLPALAADLALDHRVVAVRERPDAPGWPDLWDCVTVDAVRAWADLDVAAAAVGLERVNLRSGRDAPHVQLHNWHSYLVRKP